MSYSFMHLKVPDELKQRLEEIQKKRNLPSVEYVLKDALTYYVAAVEQRDAGGNIFFEHGEGKDFQRIPVFI